MPGFIHLAVFSCSAEFRHVVLGGTKLKTAWLDIGSGARQPKRFPGPTPVGDSLWRYL